MLKLLIREMSRNYSNLLLRAVLLRRRSFPSDPPEYVHEDSLAFLEEVTSR